MKRESYFSWGYLVLCTLMILAGGIIYILFRQSEPQFYRWTGSTLIYDRISSIRQQSLLLVSSLPAWFIYSLPNALWGFSYALLITLIWWRERSAMKYVWLASIPFLVIGFELLQFTSCISGTYSIEDIVFGFTGITAGFLTGLKPNKSVGQRKKLPLI